MAKKKAKKQAARKASKKKSAARKPAKRAAKAAAPSLEALARKIVRATQNPEFPFVTLYSADCTSAEAAGEPVRGHAGIEEKNKGWAQMQTSAKWKARNVWTSKGTICIEWDGEVQMRDGRLVNLREVAVHEIKDGKIQHERYYYNPMLLAPPAAAAS
jgi:hypothetical protein